MVRVTSPKVEYRVFRKFLLEVKNKPARAAPLVRAPFLSSVRACSPATGKFYAAAMQRLFSTFPGGKPGLGLIILRVCAVSALVTIAVDRGPLALASWPGVGLGLLSLFIMLGALTPVACTLGALVETSFLVQRHWTDMRFVVLALMVIAALGLLGPGAYSLDGRLFGRRLIFPNGE